jgi:hypothetical protein
MGTGSPRSTRGDDYCLGTTHAHHLTEAGHHGFIDRGAVNLYGLFATRSWWLDTPVLPLGPERSRCL